MSTGLTNIKSYRSNGDHDIAVHGKDEDLIVRFYEEEEIFYRDLNPSSPDMEAADAIKKITEFCEMRFPGDSTKVKVKRVSEHPDLRYRFARQYEAFKKGEEFKKSGMSLAETGYFSKQQIKEMEAKYIFTVEQFITVPDHFLQNILGGYKLKQKCAAWLDAAKEKKDTKTSESVEELKEQIKALTASMAEMQSKKLTMKKEQQ